MSDVEQLITQLSNIFNIPPPRYILGSPLAGNHEAVFDTATYTIHFKSNNPHPRVVIHEVAHAAHTYYNVPLSRSEAEAFARTFERVWYEGHGQLTKCQVCGYPLPLAYEGNEITCPRCKTTYHYSLSYPGFGEFFAGFLLGFIGGFLLFTATGRELAKMGLKKGFEISTTTAEKIRKAIERRKR